MKKQFKSLTLLSASIMLLASCNESNYVKEIKVYKGTETYIVGEIFAPMQISVTFANGDRKLVDVTEDMVRGFDTSVAGQKTILIYYEGEVIEYAITVVDLYLESIEVKEGYKDIYILEEFYTDGDASLVLNYTDKSQKEVSITSDMIVAFSTENVGASLVAVRYKDFTASYEITVREPDVIEVEVAEDTETIYFLGDEFKGVNLNLTYENGKEETVLLDDASILKGFDTETKGKKVLTFAYKGISCQYEIDVYPHVSSLEVEGWKEIYEPDEEFAGAKLKVLYEDESTEEIDVKAQMMEGFDTSTTGKKEVTIFYLDQALKTSIIVPLINRRDYDALEGEKVFMFEVEDEGYVDLSACETSPAGQNKLEENPGASGKNTSNMGVVNGNVMKMQFYSSMEGTFTIQMRVQSASDKGGSAQELVKIMDLTVNGENRAVEGVAEKAGTGNWQNMVNWNVTTICQPVALKKGLNTFELTSKDCSSSVRFPNVDYFNIVVRA